MCGLCGLLDSGGDWTRGAPQPGEPAYYAHRRARAETARIAAAVLRPLRVAVEDFEGRAFVVRGPTGGAEIVGGLMEIWAAAERLAGKRIDPLDPAFLDDGAAQP